MKERALEVAFTHFLCPFTVQHIHKSFSSCWPETDSEVVLLISSTNPRLYQSYQKWDKYADVLSNFNVRNIPVGLARGGS